MNLCLCGAPATPIKRRPDYYCVYCSACGASTGWHHSPQDATTTWNELVRIKTRARKIAPTEYPKIVEYYTKHHTPVLKLAELYGVTRLSIYNILRKSNIKTGSYGKLVVRCEYCGAKIERFRSVVKRSKYSFCSTEHQALHFNKGGAFSIRSRIRRAKKIVKDAGFNMSCGNIVFWQGAIPYLENLEVYKNKNDLVNGSDPIWRGSENIGEFL